MDYIDQNHQRLPTLCKVIILVIGLISFGASTIFTVFLPYCENALQLSISQGNALFSNWLTMFFIAPVFAGYIGHRYLGNVKAISIGLLIGLIGELILASKSLSFAYVALILFALGIGLYTTSIYVLFGKQFAENDVNRSKAFIYLYVSMNIGALLGDFSSGLVIKILGYSTLFVVITLPKFIAIIIFYLNTRDYKTIPFTKVSFLILLAYLLGGFILCWYLMHHPDYLKTFSLALLFLCAFYFMLRTYNEPKRYLNLAKAFLLFTVFILLYWALYMLYPSVVEIFVEHKSNLYIGNIKIQPSTIASCSPLFLVVFGLLLAKLKRNNDSMKVISNKLVFALVSMGISFFVLIGSVYLIKDSSIFLLFIILGYAIYALSEILIGPIGYAMVGLLVEEKLLGLMMGFTYLVHSVSGEATGELTKVVTHLSQNYQLIFTTYGIIALTLGASLMLLYNIFFKRMTDEV